MESTQKRPLLAQFLKAQPHLLRVVARDLLEEPEHRGGADLLQKVRLVTAHGIDVFDLVRCLHAKHPFCHFIANTIVQQTDGNVHRSAQKIVCEAEYFARIIPDIVLCKQEFLWENLSIY